MKKAIKEKIAQKKHSWTMAIGQTQRNIGIEWLDLEIELNKLEKESRK